MSLTDKQVEQLLKPINPKRVLRDAKGHSHVSQQDVTAHLIRVFGFGNFDFDVLNVECIFEEPSIDKKTAEVRAGRFDVCYRALMRLTVRTPAGDVLCHYVDGSTATAQNQTRGDAHDLAYKSAISLSKKRCAINLGDQFGLSLYNKGQMTALVGATIPGADAPEDVQADVEQQVSLGNDETAHEEPVEPDPADVQRDRLRQVMRAKNLPLQLAVERFSNAHDQDLATSSDAELIAALADDFAAQEVSA